MADWQGFKVILDLGHYKFSLRYLEQSGPKTICANLPPGSLSRGRSKKQKHLVIRYKKDDQFNSAFPVFF